MSESYGELEMKIQRKLMENLRDEKLNIDDYRKASRSISAILHYLSITVGEDIY